MCVGRFILEKDMRIAEIMDKHDCDEDVAEQLFCDEICEKYDTDDLSLAEELFFAESEEED